MPIFDQIQKIDPRQNGVGVALPLDKDNLFKSTRSMKEQVKTNIINCLLTEPGERFNLPTFGLGLKKLLFEQNINAELLKTNIQNQLSIWVPKIKLHHIGITQSNDGNSFVINITYIYLLDGSSDGVELKFY
jgi:phage baseplate assembly protein W